MTFRFTAILLLFVVPLGLRLAPIDHGSPRNYVEDTHVVRNALGMAKDRNPVPASGQYSSYPNLVPYALLPLYAGQMVLGNLTGKWEGTDGYKTYILEHPESAQLLARMLVALFGALTPWVVYRTARAAGLGTGAWVAAWLTGTSLLHIHYSVQERPWVPLVFFMAFAAWPAAKYVKDGRPRMLILSGVAGALSFSCHQGGLPALGIAGLAWFFGPKNETAPWSGPTLKSRVILGFKCVAAFLVVALVVGHPYLLVHGLTPSGVGQGVADQGGIAVGGQGLLLEFDIASLPLQAWSFLGYDPVLLVLSIFGIVATLKRPETRPAVGLGVVWALFFGLHENQHVRYILPLTVLFAPAAGWTVERWATNRGMKVLFGCLLALPLIPALRFDVVMSRADTRAEGEAKLADLPEGARVAIDRYGPAVDATRSSLELLHEIRTECEDQLRTRERHRLDELQAGTGRLPVGIEALRIEDLVTTDASVGSARVRNALLERGETVEELLDGLGVTHFLLVRRSTVDGGDSMLEFLVRDSEPILVIDPSGDDGSERAHLPNDMVFPLIDLWRVERPGPWMALFEL